MTDAVQATASFNEGEKVPYIVGFLSGCTLALPLVGRIGPIPGSFLSIFIAVGIAAYALVHFREWTAPPRTALWSVISGFSYAALIAVAASRLQLSFFTDFARWRIHERYYYESKLLDFAIVILPLLLVSASLCFLPKASRRKVAVGMLWSFVVIATVCALRVIQYTGILIGSDEKTSTPFYGGAYTIGFTTVSYGILFVLGSIAALNLRRTWVLTALFLFMALWLNRKTESILIVLAVIAHVGFMWQRYSTPLVSAVGKSLVIFGIAAALIIPLHNVSNIVTWKLLTQNFYTRMDMLNLEKEANVVIDSIPQASIGNSGTMLPLEQKARSEDRDISDVLIGSGLGWYALQGGELYPHNIVLENYLESGAISLIPLFSLVWIAIAICFVRARKNDYPPLAMALVFMSLAMLSISMKAGELTVAGRLVGVLMFSSILVTAFDRKSDAT
jgi:hypothetical protein